MKASIKPGAIHFRGYYWDSESALYYMPARFYDPAVGRFISVDPAPPKAGSPITLNAYAYCVNSPIMLDDPAGDDPPGKGVNKPGSDENKANLEFTRWYWKAYGWRVKRYRSRYEVVHTRLFGVEGGFFHVYVRDTKSSSLWGMNGSWSSGFSGDGGGPPAEDMPPEPVYLKYSQTEAGFARAMNAHNWHAGQYCIFKNDCHTSAKAAFDDGGYTYPGSTRFSPGFIDNSILTVRKVMSPFGFLSPQGQLR